MPLTYTKHVVAIPLFTAMSYSYVSPWKRKLTRSILRVDDVLETLSQKATWMTAVGIAKILILDDLWLRLSLMWNEFCGDSPHARIFSQHSEESSYAFSHFFSYFAYCLLITYMSAPWPLLHFYVRRGRAAGIWAYSHETRPL